MGTWWYLSKSTIWPCMECYCWVGLVLLDFADTWICWISYRTRYVGQVVLHLVLFLSPWLFSISIMIVDVHLNWLNWFHSSILVEDPFVILIDCMISFLPFLNVIGMTMSTISFLAHLHAGMICRKIAYLWSKWF